MKKLPLGRSLAGIAILLVPLVLFAQVAGDHPADTARSVDELQPVHVDTQALVQGVLEATRAFLREDAVAFRAGLDRVETATRELDREADAGYGSDLIIYEQAFRVTLDRARELAARGKLESAHRQFGWVQRSCVTCHGMARERGLLPVEAEGSGESE